MLVHNYCGFFNKFYSGYVRDLGGWRCRYFCAVFVFVWNPPLLTLIVVIPPITNTVWIVDDDEWMIPLLTHQTLFLRWTSLSETQTLFLLTFLQRNPNLSDEILQERALFVLLQQLDENSALLLSESSWWPVQPISMLFPVFQEWCSNGPNSRFVSLYLNFLNNLFTWFLLIVPSPKSLLRSRNNCYISALFKVVEHNLANMDIIFDTKKRLLLMKKCRFLKKKVSKDPQ